MQDKYEQTKLTSFFKPAEQLVAEELKTIKVSNVDWNVAQKVLQKQFGSIGELEQAIKSYRRSVRNLKGLDSALNLMKPLQRLNFWTCTLPAIQKFALQACFEEIPKLPSGKCGLVKVDKKLITFLMAKSFLCLVEERESNYPRIDLSSLLSVKDERKLPVKAQKLLCFIHYFHRQIKGVDCQIAVRRNVLLNHSAHLNDHALAEVQFVLDGGIEDAVGCVKTNFANKRLGGGYLNNKGCLQEEILFCLYPELYAGALVCEEMRFNEAIFIENLERYSSHSGYADDFKWTGDFKNSSKEKILCVDAMHFKSRDEQFTVEAINCELSKLNAAFSMLDPGSALATGHWGCGAFGGDLELKFILQLMAASSFKLFLRYYTFMDEKFHQSAEVFYSFLKQHNITVQILFKALLWLLLDPQRVEKDKIFDHVRDFLIKT